MKNVRVDEWEKQVDVNCKGVMNTVAAVLPGMLKQESGHVINISSDAGRKVCQYKTVLTYDNLYAKRTICFFIFCGPIRTMSSPRKDFRK